MLYNCENHHNCIVSALSYAETICIDRKANFTKLRKKMFELVLTSQGPIKAYEILEYLKTEDCSATPPTVYRALDFLLKNNLIHKIETQNAFVACAYPLHKHDCVILVCTLCNRVEEYCNKIIEAEIIKLITENNFVATKITLEVQGVCKTCKT